MRHTLPLLGLSLLAAGAVLAAPMKVDPKDVKTTASGLKYAILKPGKGPGAVKNQQVKLHYTGWLSTGKEFDSSRKGDAPFQVTLGRGLVIPGFDEGLMGMTVGELRQLTIPPKLGYGDRNVGNGVIPPNSTLIFEVELVELGGIFEPSEAPAKVDPEKVKRLESGVQYAVLTEGTGEPLKKGQKVLVHYTGWLKDGGKKFDSSVDRGQPIRIALGMPGLIEGWNQGVEGMKVGEKRQLIIPAKLGYGEGGRQPLIPGNADLIFEIQIVKTTD